MKYILLSISLLTTITGWSQNASPAAKGIVSIPPKTDDYTKQQVYTFVDSMPSIDYDLKQYLAENVHYPDSALVHNIEGRVIVKFIVSENGNVEGCRIQRGVNKYLDAEALRVVRTMPPWKPGKRNGKPVNVYFTLPIVFKLAD